MNLKPYRPIPKHNSDWLTYAVRFVCGAIVGLIVGGLLSLRYLHSTSWGIAFDGYITISVRYIVNTICISLFVGVFAAIYGDRFWEWFGGTRS